MVQQKDEAILDRDLPEFVSLMSSLQTHASDSSVHIVNLKSGDQSEDRMSFIDTKCHLFLEYLIDLTYLMLLKVDGRSLVDQKCVERLVRTRTVLEKIRPIDKKLQYQIDKLVKMATLDAKQASSHPLSFKPNIDDLVTKEESENSEEDEEQNQVYVPPKVNAVHFDDDSELKKKEKKLKKSREKLLNKNLLEELCEEYSDAPQEIKSRRTLKRAKMQEKEDEQTRYEEDNLRRLMLTKKEKKKGKQTNEFDDIVKMGSFRGLEEQSDSDDQQEQYQPKKKNGKMGPKKFKKRMQKKR